MSNVVAFRSPHSPRPTDCLRDLVTHVAAHRRSVGDVLWLKENAELLALLANTGQRVAPETLSAYADFYAGIDAQMAFFPQYYRFLLSICLDLEDLGLPGDKGAALCDFVARQGLAQAELSDLQRAEAERLLARRNVGRRDDALAARLDAFMDRSATFAIPNKKAAYELTHIVFYRARYGLARASLSQVAHRGLENAGLVAFLDQDMDLLAEVCAAQRLAGRVPPRAWEEAVRQAHVEFTFVPGSPGGTADDLHSYIVTGWASHLQGAAMLPCRVGPPAGGAADAGPSRRRVAAHVAGIAGDGRPAATRLACNGRPAAPGIERRGADDAECDRYRITPLGGILRGFRKSEDGRRDRPARDSTGPPGAPQHLGGVTHPT